MSRRKFMVNCKPFNCETLGWSFDCVCVCKQAWEKKRKPKTTLEKSCFVFMIVKLLRAKIEFNSQEDNFNRQ